MKVTKAAGWMSRPGVPLRLLLPFVALALIEIAVLHRRNEFLRRSQIVAVIGFVVAGESHHRGVMEIVIPQAIQAVPALFRRLHQLHLLRFVFGDKDHSRGAACSRASRAIARRI